MSNIQVSGSYTGELTLPSGEKIPFNIANTVKRSSLASLLLGNNVISALALGKSIVQPTFTESAITIQPVKVVPTTKYSSMVDRFNGSIIHKWTFEITDSSILTDITELSVGLPGSNFTEFSRVIITDNGKLIRLNKKAEDHLTITYTLVIKTSNNNNSYTSLELNGKTYNSLAYPIFPLVRNINSDNNAKLYYKFLSEPTNILKPFTLPDESYTEESITTDDLSLENNSIILLKQIDLVVPEGESRNIYGLVILSPFSSVQYHFTPRISLASDGFINFLINLRISNG